MIYRRIWLAILVVVFAVVAPAVVFYTAGYRWNAKKGVIERNGTLIIDTKPTGARIFLNGQDTGDTSPTTRQDIAPGTYNIRLEESGYWPWEKTLEIRPERVTFVTDVWLWPQSEPTLLHEAPIAGIAASPNGDYLAFVEQIQDETRLVIQTVPDNGIFGIPTGAGGEEHIMTFQQEAPTEAVHLIWNDDSNGVLINDATGNAWAANIDAEAADHLPTESQYRWEGNVIVGVRPNERFTYSLFGGTVQQTELDQGVIDEQGRYQIIEEANGLRSIVERGDDSRQFILPSGAWVFAGAEGSWMFLRDNGRWLAFHPGANDDEIRSVSLPVTLPPAQTKLNGDTIFLSYGNGEVWSVELGEPSQLLTRASQAIAGAVWHPESPYVFYATQNDLNALGLDTRDGREQVTLASFEHITQLTLAGTDLYLAGTKGQKTGIWMIPTE